MAVRVRPLLSFEKTERLGECLSCIPQSKQLCVGDGGDNGRNTFTFDFTFPTGCEQRTLYNDCVASLLEGGRGGTIACLSRRLPPSRLLVVSSLSPVELGVSVAACLSLLSSCSGTPLVYRQTGSHLEQTVSVLLSQLDRLPPGARYETSPTQACSCISILVSFVKLATIRRVFDPLSCSCRGSFQRDRTVVSHSRERLDSVSHPTAHLI